MLVKYCGICSGRPYTTEMQLNNCPKCGSQLSIESADEIELEERVQIVVPQKPISDNGGFEDTLPNKPFSNFGADNENDIDADYPQNVPAEKTDSSKNVFFSTSKKGAFVSDKTIRGKVVQYSSSGREDGIYRRHLPVKIYQALVYRQRLEDVLHRFLVRVEQGEDGLGYQDSVYIPVNVHGTISGGLQIYDNAEVEVHGKYRNSVLMADRVDIINNGYKSKVGFQRSVKAITYGILFAIILALICFVAASSNGTFLADAKEFCVVWLVFAAILTIIYLMLSLTKIVLFARMFSNKRRSFPFVGILIISLVLALLFVSVFGSFAGFASFLSGWIYALIPIIIMVIAVFFLLKKIVVG